MNLEERVRELSWMCEALGSEVQTLQEGTDHPVMHQFLALSIARGIERRAAGMQHIVIESDSPDREEEPNYDQVA